MDPDTQPFEDFECQAPYDLDALRTISQKQFGSQPVPQDYLDQIRHHLNFFPDDYLFQLIPFGANGFGSVICREPGCDPTPIALDRRTSRIDGGRSAGVGGLAKFQSHILDHDDHERLRDERIARRTRAKEPIPTPSSLSDPNSIEPPGPSSVDARTVSSMDDHKSKKPRLAWDATASSSPKEQTFLHGDIDDLNRIETETDQLNLVDMNPPQDKPLICPPAAKPLPVCIDLCDSDSEDSVRLISLPNLKPEGPVDVDALTSDEDDDLIWLDGEGLVPLNRFGNPNSNSKPPAVSRLATSVSKHKSLLDDRKPVPSTSTADPQLAPSSFYRHSASRPPSQLENSMNGSTCRQSPPSLSTGFPFSSTRSSFPLFSSFSSSPSSCSTFPKTERDSKHVFPTRFELVTSSSPFSSSNTFDSPLLVDDDDQDYFGGLDEPLAFFRRFCSPSSSSLSRPVPFMYTPDEPRLRPEDLQEFYKRAVDNMDFTHSATVTEARTSLGIGDGEGDRMEGLSCKLMAHQIIGVSWMVAQEKSKNMGGILGDEMGLGKTVQMIATIVKQQSTDRKVKTTLVLAPLALLQQWKEEIELHSACGLKVMIYHSSFDKQYQKRKLSSFDIVISTLDILLRDWDEPKEGCTQKKYGLFKVDWYRVVIDEAQIVRNPRAKKSNAVCDLKSVFRWCLTGTPIFNGLLDIFPYIRFLRIRPYNDLREFRLHVIAWEKKRPNLATQRAQAVLATCMLRRTKDTKLDGQSLIVLPSKTVQDVMIDMPPKERAIYDMVEKRVQQKFNTFLRKGTVLKNIASVLVLLLRLRQACGHSDLVTEEDKNAADDAALSDPKKELQRAIDNLGKDWVERMRQKFQIESEELIQSEKLKSVEAVAPECPICSDTLDDTARVTKCSHVFCEGCLETLLAQVDPMLDHNRPTDPNLVSKPCPNCRAQFQRSDTYLKAAFLPPPDDSDDEDGALSGAGCTVRHKMKNGVLNDSDDDEKIVSPKKDKGKGKATGNLGFISYKSEFEHSAKTAWFMEEIHRVWKESPDDKIIIVSQWTSMLHICSTFLREHNIDCVVYQGKMSTEERCEAVATFKRSRSCRIMLMSLKCGGVGLNLTCANRVISLDLAWSPAAERQAFDRVHRLGQLKDVFVNRVMIRNTVEQRICDLQSRKQDITDNTLGEGPGKKLKKMTVGELANLFNLNENGETLD